MFFKKKLCVLRYNIFKSAKVGMKQDIEFFGFCRYYKKQGGVTNNSKFILKWKKYSYKKSVYLSSVYCDFLVRKNKALY